MLCIESSGHFREKDACSQLHTLPHPMITSHRDTDLSDRLYDLWIIIFLDRLRHRSWHEKIEQTSRIKCKHAVLLRMTAFVMWLVIWWCKHKGLWRERPQEFSDRSGAVPTERESETICARRKFICLCQLAPVGFWCLLKSPDRKTAAVTKRQLWMQAQWACRWTNLGRLLFLNSISHQRASFASRCLTFRTYLSLLRQQLIIHMTLLCFLIIVWRINPPSLD